jgi:ribosomal protein S18 acetylase RimI-like enzyme
MVPALLSRTGGRNDEEISMATIRLPVELTVRDLEAEDLGDLAWSGGSEHITALAEALQRTYAGEVDLVLVSASNGLPVAVGAVDFSKRDDAGELWMLSVHPHWQSLGVGTLLITALEERIRGRGLSRATLGVEHDNPRAAALYRRLGYAETGTVVDGWPIAPGRRYATVCFSMSKDLAPSSRR